MSETVFDPIRKKQVQAFPEEVLRQKILQWLLQKIKIPPQALQVEYPLPGSSFFADICAHHVDAEGKIQGTLLVEIKRPGVKIGEEVWAQVQRYLTFQKFQFIMVTNGAEFFFLKATDNQFDAIEELPLWEKMKTKTP